MRKKYLIKRVCGFTLMNGRINGEDIIDLKFHVPKSITEKHREQKLRNTEMHWH